MHTLAQEALHRHDARCKARTLHDDHTIPRISAPPARVSDATHNRTITGIIRRFYSDFNTVFVVPLLLLAAGVGFPAACF